MRLDERSIRERLINGQLKGEKKNVGLREKWFVYSGSVEAARSKDSSLAAETGTFEDVTIESEPVEQNFDPGVTDDQRPQQEIDDDWIEMNRDRVKVLAEEIVKPLMEKIENQAEVIFEQKRTISEQDRQLRLLPDLQKQAEERAKDAELKHVEAEALKKQIEALETRNVEHEALKKEVDTLRSELEAARKPWWKKVFGSSDG